MLLEELICVFLTNTVSSDSEELIHIDLISTAMQDSDVGAIRLKLE